MNGIYVYPCGHINADGDPFLTISTGRLAKGCEMNGIIVKSCGHLVWGKQRFATLQKDIGCALCDKQTMPNTSSNKRKEWHNERA